MRVVRAVTSTLLAMWVVAVGVFLIRGAPIADEEDPCDSVVADYRRAANEARELWEQADEFPAKKNIEGATHQGRIVARIVLNNQECFSATTVAEWQEGLELTLLE